MTIVNEIWGLERIDSGTLKARTNFKINSRRLKNTSPAHKNRGKQQTTLPEQFYQSLYTGKYSSVLALRFD